MYGPPAWRGARQSCEDAEALAAHYECSAMQSYLLKRANLNCVLPRRTFTVVDTYNLWTTLLYGTETHTKEINTHNGLFMTNGYKYFRLHFLLGERGKEGREKRGWGSEGEIDSGSFSMQPEWRDSRNQALAHATYTMSIMCKRIEFQCHIQLS